MAVADFRAGAPPGAQFVAQNYFVEYFPSFIRPKTYVNFARRGI
jgi:hypothetical protein